MGMKYVLISERIRYGYEMLKIILGALDGNGRYTDAFGYFFANDDGLLSF